MCMQNGSLSVRAAVEKLFAFAIYATVIGFVLIGTVAMCVPSAGIA